MSRLAWGKTRTKPTRSSKISRSAPRLGLCRTDMTDPPRLEVRRSRRESTTGLTTRSRYRGSKVSSLRHRGPSPRLNLDEPPAIVDGVNPKAFDANLARSSLPEAISILEQTVQARLHGWLRPSRFTASCGRINSQTRVGDPGTANSGIRRQRLDAQVADRDESAKRQTWRGKRRGGPFETVKHCDHHADSAAHGLDGLDSLKGRTTGCCHIIDDRDRRARFERAFDELSRSVPFGLFSHQEAAKPAETGGSGYRQSCADDRVGSQRQPSNSVDRKFVWMRSSTPAPIKRAPSADRVTLRPSTYNASCARSPT